MVILCWYLLKLIICSGILTGYYYLALRNKVFHRWNRFYLLGSIALSLVVPFLKINIAPTSSANPGAVLHLLQGIDASDAIVVEYGKHHGLQWTTATIVMGGYLLITLFFLTLFLISLYRIFLLREKFPAVKMNGINFISTDAKGTPFSFFRSIFWNNAIDLQTRQGQQIFTHEITHVREKHSIDKLMINLILIFFWMNPFFWIMKKEIDMIHEFIADQNMAEGNDPGEFAAMLLQTIYPSHSFQLTNRFFHSPLKRRILMFTKNKPVKASYLSRLLVLPIATLVFMAFTFRVHGTRVLAPSAIGAPILYAAGDTLPAPPTPPTPPPPPPPPRVPPPPPPPAETGLADHPPIIYIDGKVVSYNQFKSLDPNAIDKIEVLKNEKAIELYGKSAKNGVVMITLKKNWSPSKEIEDTKPASSPLYILDGKETSGEIINSISPARIASVNVLKGAQAIAKYGDNGRNGAVEVTLKPSGDVQAGDDPDKIFTQVENQAQFPGGNSAWTQYIQSRIMAKMDSFSNKDFGTCMVRFIVNTDGSISQVEATSMQGTHLASTVVDAIKTGPNWIPATQNGHVVAAYKFQPVTLANPGK